jgi:transcription elongation factor GreA
MGEEKFYLTKKGLERLTKEFEELKKIRKSKTEGESPQILHSEDINPEYLSFHEDLSFLEVRIEELKHIFKNIELIKLPKKSKRNTVMLGATVTLEEKGGQINEFMVVGTLEANPSEGKISSDSPVGKTLLGSKIGDQVQITSPIRVFYKVKKIKYG